MSDREERLAIAARIAKARESAGMNQAQLARAMKIRSQRLNTWEAGLALPNSPRLWRSLCATLGVHADYILFGVIKGLDEETKKRLFR